MSILIGANNYSLSNSVDYTLHIVTMPTANFHNKMSSAVSSLKGTKRSPLPPLSRNSQHGDIRSASSLGNLDMRSIRDSSVLDSMTQRSIVDELRKTRGGNLPSVQKKRGIGPLRPSSECDMR